MTDYLLKAKKMPIQKLAQVLRNNEEIKALLIEAMTWISEDAHDTDAVDIHKRVRKALKFD